MGRARVAVERRGRRRGASKYGMPSFSATRSRAHEVGIERAQPLSPAAKYGMQLACRREASRLTGAAAGLGRKSGAGQARVRDDDGERIARRAEEARTHDHVAVGVAVGRRAEDGRLARRLDLAPLLVESHPRDQLDRVRQVWVRVAVRRRGGPAEVLLWLACRRVADVSWPSPARAPPLPPPRARRLGLAVHQRRSGRAKLVDEDLLGVRALHACGTCRGRVAGVSSPGRGGTAPPARAVHPVVHEAEVLARKERLDGPKVEHLLEQALVVLDAVEDVDAEGAAAERVRARRGQVNFGQAYSPATRRGETLLPETGREVRAVCGRAPQQSLYSLMVVVLV